MNTAMPSPAKAWVAATRPATLPLSLAPIVLGNALSVGHGLKAWIFFASLFTTLCLQIAANLINDLMDFKRGADQADRLGPPRAAAQGWLSPRALSFGAIGCLLLATAAGLPLVIHGGWPFAALGLLAILAAAGYTAGPLPLAYLGLGDVFVFFFFGPVAVAGVALLQLQELPFLAWPASIAIGCPATAVLVVNNLRDHESDERAGKRTLVVRLGLNAGRSQYTALMIFPFVAIAISVFTGKAPLLWLLSFAAAPYFFYQVGSVLQQQGAPLNRNLGGTAQAAALLALLLTLAEVATAMGTP